MQEKKIHVTVSLFFKVIGSGIAEGVTLYCESKCDLNTENLSKFNLQKYAKTQIEGYTELLKVPEENVRIVSRQEFEENTEED